MISITEIESKYEVQSIRYNGIPVWPIIRIYIASKIILNKNRVTIKKDNIFKLICSFYRGISNLLFGKVDYIAFSDTDRRVLINGEYYDRLVDPIADEINMLDIETPLFSHYPKNLTHTKKLSSRLPFTLLEEIISFFFPKRKIESENLLIEILKEYDLSIKYRKIIKHAFAQELLMGFYLKYKKIKGVFVVVSYTKPGIIRACKKLKIPVIEIQHGIINKTHYAYNVPKRIDESFYPDYLLTYGDVEKDIFTESNFFINKDNVLPIGNYLIDFYRNTPIEETEFEYKTREFKFSVAVTGQVAFDNLLIPFLIELANVNEKVAFIFIPRGQNFFYTNSIPIPKNIIFIRSLNTYDIIRRANFHATITSTCAIEALALGKPNIFININGWSYTYYEHLKNFKYNYFINNIYEFTNIIKSNLFFNKFEIINEYSYFIKENYNKNLFNILSKLNFFGNVKRV